MTGRRRTLAQRRRMLGYTQERLAEMLGVERSTVVRWEAGGSCPQPWYRPRLAKVLAVSLEDLHIMLIHGEPVEDAADDLPGDPGTIRYSLLRGVTGVLSKRQQC